MVNSIIRIIFIKSETPYHNDNIPNRDKHYRKDYYSLYCFYSTVSMSITSD